MRITDFAKLANVHPMTVRRWIKEGRIKAERKNTKGFATVWDIPLSEIQKVTKNECDK